MFKSIQIRVMLILMVLAIIMFLLGGYFFIGRLQALQGAVQESELISAQIQQTQLLITLITASFLVISVVIIIFTSRTIISPIAKLIKNAKKIAER